MEMKNKYKQQKQAAQQDGLVMLPGRRDPFGAAELQEDEQSNKGSDEEVQILAGKRPANLDEILERQNEAEKRYQQLKDETDEKYKGLTLKQKKELMEEEQKQQENQRQAAGDKGNNNFNKKAAPAKKKMATKKTSKRPAWNFDTELVEEKKDAAFDDNSDIVLEPPAKKDNKPLRAIWPEQANNFGDQVPMHQPSDEVEPMDDDLPSPKANRDH